MTGRGNLAAQRIIMNIGLQTAIISDNLPRTLRSPFEVAKPNPAIRSKFDVHNEHYDRM